MNNFLVGYSEININPELNVAIDGYYVERFGRGFLDDLKAQAIAYSFNGEIFLWVSVDTCLIREDSIEKMHSAIEKRCGVKESNILISATHSHTTPANVPTDMFVAPAEPVHRYQAFLVERVAEVCENAINSLRPAKMGFSTGYAPARVAYIRRYRMKDGSTMTCPPINDPNIEGPIGELDNRVHILRFDREGAETVVVVNYGVHADTVNGDLYSSDFIGVMRDTLEKALDGVKCIFVPGAQGDVGSTNVHPTKSDMNDTEISFDNEMKSPGMARFVGRALAGTVLQIYDKVDYTDVSEVRVISKKVLIPSNMPKPEELGRAKEYKALHEAGRDSEIPYSAMELTTVVAEAIRMCELEFGPENFELELRAIKVGGAVMLGIPGEPFTDVGVEIKKSEGFDIVMPCALTNGYKGYFPMKSAFDEGGYEARTSRYKGGVAEIIISSAKELLREFN